ncbi:MAG: hypothetical protein QOE70_5301 [Chthoniobacter sp.]|jgi:hypothetical protein|nr:hypothetical protein [Chthoniobacter sp.]
MHLVPQIPQPSSVELALTQGLAPGAKLRENRLFVLSRTGVEFKGEMTLAQWMEGMLMLSWMKTAYTVWLADFIKCGRQRFQQETVEEALVQLEFTELDVSRALAIADVPGELRSDYLTSEHYFVLGRSGLDDDQTKRWAAAAEEHHLSAAQLKDSIAAGEVVKQTGTPAGSRGLPTIQGFRQMFDRWWTQVHTHDPVNRWPKERKLQLFEELRPSVQVGLQLARELGINLEEGR